MKPYDFILLEPLYWHIAHITTDMCNLAKILCQVGKKVAVVDYLKENSYHEKQKYDVIKILPGKNFPKKEIIDAEKNKIKRLIKIIRLDAQRYSYFKYIYNQIKSLSDNIYFGTYTTDSFAIFLLSFKKRNIYFWGIRSYYFTRAHFAIINNPYTALRNWFMRIKIIKNKNIKFFVSNIFIKAEFAKGGVEIDRLIERPERTIDKMPSQGYGHLCKEFTLLTSGFIRRQKNLEFSLDVTEKLCVCFIIAGSSNDDYARKLDKYIESQNFKHIIRKRGFISGADYHHLFMESHFILFADKNQKSTTSSGTFLEALLRGRPVIAPDQKPYNYYVKRYNIGLLYTPNDEESLKEAIEMAKILGTKYFHYPLVFFQREYLLETVAQAVRKQL